MNLTPTELGLQSRVDKREIARAKADEILNMDAPTDTDDQHLALLREEMTGLDVEIDQLVKDKEADDKAREQSKLVRQALISQSGDLPDDGAVYHTMAEYAIDYIMTRESPVCSKIRTQYGNESTVKAAEARLQLLKRTVPDPTLSSNVGGLQPPQFINQIFQVIDNSRPVVASAQRSTLERGVLTYPAITQRPEVAVQAAEKTVAGDQGMIVTMETATASTYLGGGDLSWQAINWSTPDALQLWFNLAASDYALKTEEDACRVVIDSGFTSGQVSDDFTVGTGDFAALIKAIGEGAAEVYSNSGRTANTIYMALDAWWYVFSLTSAAFAQFATVSEGRIGPMTFVPSRGMDAGTIIVGDNAGLLVAETAGAPVELRVVEPAIGGVEVGIIGAFEAVVVDPGAFALISTAS